MSVQPNRRCLGIFVSIALSLASLCSISLAQTTKPNYYPATSDGLTLYFKDMLLATDRNDQERLLAMCQALVLPKSLDWFNDVFGKEKGAKLAEAYDKDMKNFGPSLASLFLRMNDPKTLQVVVTRIETPEDPQTKLAQTYALEAMQKPVTLYTVQIKKEGTTSAITLWSLVYSDNNFRVAGKMLVLQDMAKGKSN